MRLRAVMTFVVLAACFVALAGMGAAPGGGEGSGAGPRSEIEAAAKAGIPVFVEVGSDHCKPCRQMLPVLDSIKKKYAGKVKVVMLDVDDHRNYAVRLGVTATPTQIMLDKTGREVGRHVGFMAEEEADRFIGKALK